MIKRTLIPFTCTHSWPRSIWYRLSPGILLFSLITCSLPPTPPGTGASQTGVASWYGPGFHGRPTASGAIYNQHELTAAHRTLPLGTRVMVTNLDNGRSTEVTINDRGPFAKGRIIDLSYAAARALGMIGLGTIPVRIEVIDSGPYKIQTIRQSLDYTLQAGSFTEIENAQRLKAQLAKSYPQIPQVSIVPVHGKDDTYYRVQMGTFSSRREAERHARQLTREGFLVIIMEK
ncbi:MAG: septal ring lytic transglycosylase RlpA family protein [Candidatus Binatia bacterium]